MYQNEKRTCRVLFLLINPIVLWRSRCRRRRRCLSSLMIHAKLFRETTLLVVPIVRFTSALIIINFIQTQWQ